MVNRKRSKAAKEAYARRKAKETDLHAQRGASTDQCDTHVEHNEKSSARSAGVINDSLNAGAKSTPQNKVSMRQSLLLFEQYEKMCQRESILPHLVSLTSSNDVDKISPAQSVTGKVNNLSKHALASIAEEDESVAASPLPDKITLKTPCKKDADQFVIPTSVSLREKKVKTLLATPKSDRSPLSPSKMYTPNIKIGDRTMANLMKSSSKMEHLYTPKASCSLEIINSSSPLTDTPAKLIDIDSPNFSLRGGPGHYSPCYVFTPGPKFTPCKDVSPSVMCTPDIKIGDKTMANLMKTNARMQHLYTPKAASHLHFEDAYSPLTSETPAKLIDVATPAGPRMSLMFTEDDVNELTFLGSVKKPKKQVTHPIKTRRSSLGSLDQVSPSDLLEFSSITTLTHE